jgi:hypothetical protein
VKKLSELKSENNGQYCVRSEKVENCEDNMREVETLSELKGEKPNLTIFCQK